MIWLFPGKDVPITARNICTCLDVAKSYSSKEMIPKVQYFSSVPYVLQLMEADTKGLSWLQEMEIVGVGGAALPAEVGDRMVKRGVNLISRFGSAECGFLLSSFRRFGQDEDWQYLRNYNPPGLIDFEPRDGNLAELVVKPGWPHMVCMYVQEAHYEELINCRPNTTARMALLPLRTCSCAIPRSTKPGYIIRVPIRN
jgi:hypothetical protein